MLRLLELRRCLLLKLLRSLHSLLCYGLRVVNRNVFLNRMQTGHNGNFGRSDPRRVKRREGELHLRNWHFLQVVESSVRLCWGGRWFLKLLEIFSKVLKIRFEGFSTHGSFHLRGRHPPTSLQIVTHDKVRRTGSLS